VKTGIQQIIALLERSQALLSLRHSGEDRNQQIIPLEAGSQITTPEDRQQFESDMQDEYWFGMR